ncbi:hypothetical protein [Dawidia soli]|uniref:Uncharacterized protein n=1 Tax=Dawidia soli TaxID=2782352 RepID=A0AAP2DE96_9BACT|nr:hypothetical protein [Dawidia soli]MBT1689140.1 hypothetical protein [Dawidia soli]
MILILALPAINLHAQNIASTTLTWKADAYLDINTGMARATSDQLVSYSNQRIEWHDEAGNVKATYSIIEINGQWTNVMNNGTILYEVRSEGRQGTIQFSRASGILSIQIVLLKPDENPDMFRFSVSTVTPL